MKIKRTSWLTATLGLLVLVLAACSTPAATTGTLEVTVNAPTGVTGFTPNVQVTGPTAIANITTLGKTTKSNLAVGAYTITPNNVTAGGKTYSGSITVGGPSPVAVTAGGTKAVTVAYTEVLPTQATLKVTINNASGSNANVGVTGQASPLTATTTLTVAPGTYTVTANSITGSGANSGIAYGGTVTGSPVTLAAGDSKEVTVNYAATNSKITVTVSGVAATAKVFVTVDNGTPETKSRTGNGDVVFTGKAFGSYAVSATGGIVGTTVDTFYIQSAAIPNVTTSAGSPAGTGTAAMVARGGSGNFGSGRMFLIGNGQLPNDPSPADDSNGIFSVADGSIVANTLNQLYDATPVTTQYLKVAFDTSGNFYYAIQSAGTSKIVRITEANLRAGNVLETDAGNKVISATALNTGSSGGLEVKDMAFDPSGNLWVVNDTGGTLVCFSSTALSGSGAITTADRAMTMPTAAPVPAPKAITFDKDGNLWFSANVTENDPSLVKARLLKISATNAGCPGAPAAAPVDVNLDISNSPSEKAGAAGDPITTPAALLYDEARNSIWVGDAGEFGATLVQEGVTEIPLANNTASGFGVFGVRVRLNVGEFQQIYGLAFDSNGKLWVATNNNVTTAGNAGKAYRISKPAAAATPSADGPTEATVAPEAVVTGAVKVGFTGIAFNTTPANVNQQLRAP